MRSDVKDYLRNFDQGVIIGRAQADYHLTLSKNNHVMFTAGILEEMFSGVGFEYLNFDNIVSSILIAIPFFLGLLFYFTLFKKSYGKIKI